MGGWGSGGAFRRIAEECQRIDIREFRKRGYLKGCWRFSWGWSVGGEPSGSISVEADPVRFTVRYIILGDEPEHVSQHIERRAARCHFGGSRHYFACPRCWRSAEVLYLASGRFYCRDCARVGYAIENLDKQWRADRRYRQLEARLNEDGSKPARMRWTTYNRICRRLERYGQVSESSLAGLFARYGWDS